MLISALRTAKWMKKLQNRNIRQRIGMQPSVDKPALKSVRMAAPSAYLALKSAAPLGRQAARMPQASAFQLIIKHRVQYAKSS
jgi:hypothetical protein